MAIDVKPILEEIESRSGLVDSTSSTQELYDLYKTGQSVGGGSNITVYETEDDLPFLLDATPDVGNLAFVKSTLSTYVKDNQGWKRQSAPVNGGILGTNAVYQATGLTNVPGTSTSSARAKFSYATEQRAALTGSLVYAQRAAAASASDTAGYITGSFYGAANGQLQKWTFANDGTVTDVGDTTPVAPAPTTTGNANSYRAVRSLSHIVNSSPQYMERFPFANETVSQWIPGWNSLVGSRKMNAFAFSNAVYGYSGCYSPTQLTRYSLVNETVSVNVDWSDYPVTGGTGNSRFTGFATSSETHGYFNGSEGEPSDLIRVPFSSDTTCVDVGNFQMKRNGSAGSSSTTKGYVLGGYTPAPYNPEISPSPGSIPLRYWGYTESFPFAHSVPFTADFLVPFATFDGSTYSMPGAYGSQGIDD